MSKHAGTDSRIDIHDLDFDLPRSQIARTPVRPRHASRLLVVGRQSGAWEDSTFEALPTHLASGDVLVLNNTRVLKARVVGSLERTGRQVEVLFAEPLADDLWGAMLHPSRRIRSGDRIHVETPLGSGCLEVGEARDHGLRAVRVVQGASGVVEFLAEYGRVPLPPYIDREASADDEEDYQTVFARHDGAVAAPTAGLHFTNRMFERLQDRGIERVELTLHVGIGTFIPIRTANLRDHRLKPETFEIPRATAETLNRARSEGRRIVAVGTTTVRTLEYVMARYQRFVPGRGETDLYILPGYRFRAVDALVTNFHLPRSTLLLLVAAFAGQAHVLDAYRHAIASGYRFYSFGDASLFL